MGRIGNDDLEYCQAWAEMMVTMWTDRIIKLGIRDSGALLSSFKQQVLMQSGGSVGKITFAFLYYGRMVAIGVHKGLTYEQRIYEGGKNPKDWYSDAFFISLRVLNEKRAQMYGEEFNAIMTDSFKSIDVALGK